MMNDDRGQKLRTETDDYKFVTQRGEVPKISPENQPFLMRLEKEGDISIFGWLFKTILDLVLIK